jgi:hypothetical protein
VDVELGGDLAAVDDEGLLELVLQFQEFPYGGVDDPKARSSSAGVLRSLVRGWPARR